MNDLPAYLILASGGLGIALLAGGVTVGFLARRRRTRIICRGLAIGGAVYTLLFILIAAPGLFTSS